MADDHLGFGISICAPPLPGGVSGHARSPQLPAARYGIHFYDQVKPSLPAALLPLKELLKALTCHAGVPQGSHTYLLSHPGEKSLKSL